MTESADCADRTLPAGWMSVRLGDVGEVRLGRQRSPENHNGPYMRPYLRAANVGWSGALLEDVKEMNFSPAEQQVYELLPGDVLLSEASGSIGEVGKPMLWGGQIPGCCFQNTLIRVRSHGAVDPAFLRYRLLLEAMLGRWAEGVARGVGIHHLGSTRVAEWRFAMPALAEQQRIVDELERRLSHVDAAVRSLQLCDRRMAAARHAIARRLALPTLGEVDGDLPALPPGWEWSTLGKVATIVGGVTKDAKRENDPGRVSVPYLRVANVQRGYLDLADVTMIRVPPEKAKSLLLEPGDILFTEGGDRDKLGRGWVWEGQIADCIHQNHVFRARLHDARLHPKLVSWIGNTFGQKWFETAGKQTTNLASVNKTTLEAFPVPIPPPGAAAGIVKEIDRRLSLVDAAAQSVASNLLRAEQLRRALLATAFNGQLVPHDPCDEPASVLVERIRGQRNDQPSTARRGRRRKENVA